MQCNTGIKLLSVWVQTRKIQIFTVFAFRKLQKTPSVIANVPLHKHAHSHIWFLSQCSRRYRCAAYTSRKQTSEYSPMLRTAVNRRTSCRPAFLSELSRCAPTHVTPDAHAGLPLCICSNKHICFSRFSGVGAAYAFLAAIIHARIDKRCFTLCTALFR